MTSKANCTAVNGDRYSEGIEILTDVAKYAFSVLGRTG